MTATRWSMTLLFVGITLAHIVTWRYPTLNGDEVSFAYYIQHGESTLRERLLPAGSPPLWKLMDHAERPLHIAFMKASTLLFGMDVRSLRLPTLFFMLAGLAGMFALAITRRWPPLSWMGVAFFFCGYLSICSTHESRQEPAIFCLMVLNAWWLQERRALSTSIGVGALSAAALFIHPLAVYMLATVGVCLFALEGRKIFFAKDRLGWMGAVVGMLAVYLFTIDLDPRIECLTLFSHLTQLVHPPAYVTLLSDPLFVLHRALVSVRPWTIDQDPWLNYFLAVALSSLIAAGIGWRRLRPSEKLWAVIPAALWFWLGLINVNKTPTYMVWLYPWLYVQMGLWLRQIKASEIDFQKVLIGIVVAHLLIFVTASRVEPTLIAWPCVLALGMWMLASPKGVWMLPILVVAAIWQFDFLVQLFLVAKAYTLRMPLVAAALIALALAAFCRRSGRIELRWGAEEGLKRFVGLYGLTVILGFSFHQSWLWAQSLRHSRQIHLEEQIRALQLRHEKRILGPSYFWFYEPTIAIHFLPHYAPTLASRVFQTLWIARRLHPTCLALDPDALAMVLASLKAEFPTLKVADAGVVTTEMYGAYRVVRLRWN